MSRPIVLAAGGVVWRGDVLEGLGVTDLRSADLPACVGMLAPSAAATGLTVRREVSLTEAEFVGNEQHIATARRAHGEEGWFVAPASPRGHDQFLRAT